MGQGAATTWSVLGAGLPNTSVNDLTAGRCRMRLPDEHATLLSLVLMSTPATQQVTDIVHLFVEQIQFT
jgi:hypothetical protein